MHPDTKIINTRFRNLYFSSDDLKSANVVVLHVDRLFIDPAHGQSLLLISH